MKKLQDKFVISVERPELSLRRLELKFRAPIMFLGHLDQLRF